MNFIDISDRVLAFERIFAAPREIVFAMWTHPKHLIRWQGPRGHALTTCEVDFRVGGSWRFCIGKGSDESWVWGTYRAIEEPSKLVYSYSMNWHRYETLVTVYFDDLGDGRTKIRFRQEEFGNAGDCDDHRWGWAAALDKLAEQLLLMQTAGLFSDLLWREPRSSGVAEDFAEAARRAAEERARDPQAAIPPRFR
jgi:uncharacterized protein YndB with AHSA1/START domain